jgi:hypothetical protein
MGLPSTIGAAFGSKKIKVDEQRVVMAIWDTAGQERYKGLVSLFFSCFLLFSWVGEGCSLEDLGTWSLDLRFS